MKHLPIKGRCCSLVRIQNQGDDAALWTNSILNISSLGYTRHDSDCYVLEPPTSLSRCMARPQTVRDDPDIRGTSSWDTTRMRPQVPDLGRDSLPTARLSVRESHGLLG